MKKKNITMNSLRFFTVLLLALAVPTITAKAATKGWNLQYGGSLPTSAYVTSQTVSGKMASKNYVTAKVSKYNCSGDGWIHLTTSTGGLSVFVNTTTTKSSPKKVDKNVSVSGTASMTNPGSLNSFFTSGTFDF